MTKYLHIRVALVGIAGLLVATSCSSTTNTTAPATQQGGPSGSTGPATGSPADSTSAVSNPPAVSKSKHGIGHVFVIVLENENYATTFAKDSPATYLNSTLLPQGKHLRQYFATGHNSLDNYISMISGQAANPKTQADCPVFSEFAMTGTGDANQAIGQGCVYPPSVFTVADQLNAGALTWKAYMEDIGNDPNSAKTCRHAAIGQPDPTSSARPGDQYAAKHNPFVYFHSIIDSPTCKERVVSLDSLSGDLGSVDTTPNFNFISPGLCHDGHDHPCVGGEPGGLVSADKFLSEWVAKIQASPAYKLDGAIVVTFDESGGFGPDGDSTSCCNEAAGPNVEKPGLSGPGGGRVGAVVVSPLVTPNTTNDTPFNHYSLLCSIEQLFDLDKLGMAGASGLACFGLGAEVFDKRK